MRLHNALPDDAVPVTAAEHQALLAAQSAGKVIRPGDDGAPTARRPTEPTEALRARLLAAVKQEAARRILAVAPLWRQLNDVRDIAATSERRAAVERRCATVDERRLRAARGGAGDDDAAPARALRRGRRSPFAGEVT
ncbi:hypothetical protein [Sphingomonas phyllosphaerae]|uniref:hypothetical protein n=1 Tax=Sphingomonas phyllosphaerae TaxID=257003 RepID=UPI0024137534|nr:hypothetical protein [Sphingomonas phyllosphaerae]